jgi:hypothetical protein
VRNIKMEISEIQAKLNELNPKLEHFRRSL